jgi:hypothetical protein
MVLVIFICPTCRKHSLNLVYVSPFNDQFCLVDVICWICGEICARKALRRIDQ